jgi:hypothetical protein
VSGTGALTCSVESTALAAPIDLSATDITHTGGFVAVRTQFTAVHYDYVVVFGVAD